MNTTVEQVALPAIETFPTTFAHQPMIENAQLITLNNEQSEINQSQVVLSDLTQPFAPEDVYFQPVKNSAGKTEKMLAYLKWLPVRDRLNTVLPLSWSLNIVNMEVHQEVDNNQTIYNVSVNANLELIVPHPRNADLDRTVRMSGIGVASASNQADAAKSATSYALVSAAYRYGIGQELTDPKRVKALELIKILPARSTRVLKMALWQAIKETGASLGIDTNVTNTESGQQLVLDFAKYLGLNITTLNREAYIEMLETYYDRTTRNAMHTV